MAPDVVVEFAGDTAVDEGRYRHPVRYLRVCDDLSPPAAATCRVIVRPRPRRRLIASDARPRSPRVAHDLPAHTGGATQKPTIPGLDVPPRRRRPLQARDQAGNLTATTVDGSTTTSTYDAADQLTQTVVDNATTKFTYDADGNRTKDAQGEYTYDPLSRLKSAQVGGNAFTFVYDADGNRTTTHKNGSLERTLRWDINNSLPQIATETGLSSETATDYQYNPAGIPNVVSSPEGTFYLTHDRQNSVAAVRDATGKATYRYTYGPWGKPNGEAVEPGGQGSPFGYTGQYKDPILEGRLYLRDRSYDPATRTFTTPDPVPAGDGTPNSSTYAYANNDPANQDDPTGNCPLCVSAGGGALFGAVIEGGIYSWNHRDDGQFSWNGLLGASGKGAVTGAVAGMVMPGSGNAAARAFGLTGARATATSAGVNAAAGAGFAWGVNEVNCRPTDPTDLLIGAAGGGASSLARIRGIQGGSATPSSAFPGINVSARAIVSPKTVFRGDSRPPSEVWRTGFQPKGSNTDIGEYALYDTPSAWVGTSKNAREARVFPQKRTNRWVYEITAPGSGISVNRQLGGSVSAYLKGKAFTNEREILFPQGIDPSRIKRAVEYTVYGLPTGRVERNPGYLP